MIVFAKFSVPRNYENITFFVKFSILIGDLKNFFTEFFENLVS